jgi:hypothetical protein
MKKLSLMATLVALVMAPGIVRAEDDDDKKDIDIRVETKVSGEVMTIGPDGKVTVEKFGDEAAGEKKNAGRSKAAKSETRVFSFGKAFKIGPDGKMEGVESLPKNIQELLKKGKLGAASVGGSITIIGPDGKKHTHALATASSTRNRFRSPLKRHSKEQGRNCPKKSRISSRRPLKDLPGALKVQIGGATPKEKDTMSQKLDEILKRLDKLEKEVKDLKANNK